jgi:hypothetical protein
MRNRKIFFFIILAALIPAQQAIAAIGKGHQILLRNGVQSYALSIKSDVFHINTVRNANFTGVMWIWGEYNNSLLGPAPGYPWARWVIDPDPPRDGTGLLSDMPPTTSPVNEAPYMSNLVALCLGDEEDLNQASIRSNMANWYATVRDNYPNTILFCNNWAYQLSDSAMGAFIGSSNPDMLSMDTYEWVTGNANSTGGSPSHLYNGMRQVRAFAGGQRPYQLYTQTYHSTGDGRRDPSDSELRLNYFAGVAFGFTSFVNFTYNTGASSLFVSPGGDTTTTPLYNTMTDINAKLRKMSPVLTRLKPRFNYISGFDAAMCYYPGQYLNGGTTTTLGPPEGDGDFKIYPTDYSAYFAHNNSDYVSSSNTGTWRGLFVPQNLGTKNNGLRGDIWVMWFTPLDDTYDGPNFSNEEYIMILNGLTDPTGTGVDCRQSIKWNLIDNAKTQNLHIFNQQTGVFDTVAVPLDTTSGRRTPTFTIDGGELVLFKYTTGAPLASVYQTAAEDWSLYR